VFSRPQEDNPRSFLKTMAITVNRIPSKSPNPPSHVMDYIDSNMESLRNKYKDFNLIESVPTTLGAIVAHRVIYTHHRNKSLTIGMMKGNKIYNSSASPA
jgi:hypothetical protein